MTLAKLWIKLAVNQFMHLTVCEIHERERECVRETKRDRERKIVIEKEIQTDRYRSRDEKHMIVINRDIDL